MRPRRLGRRPSRLGAARRAPQGGGQQLSFPRRAPRPGYAHHSSSPPGLTRWSMPTAVLETHRPIRLSLPSAWIAGSSPAMTKEKGRKKKGSGTPTDVFSQPPHLAMRRMPLSLSPPPRAGEGSGGGTLAYRRSTAALAAASERRSSAPDTHFLGLGRTQRSQSFEQPGSKNRALLQRALPAPSCPSPASFISQTGRNAGRA